MIDWEEQWATHAPYFSNGLASVPLLGGQIKLKPGPGFGDFSHPTTRLAIELMIPYVRGARFLDIGCGSGILSLAAIHLGASWALSCDIDPLALSHTQENATLNGMQDKIFFEPLKENPTLVTMNMISSEQEVAWPCYQDRCKEVKILISSGILAEQRKEYLKLTQKWGWILKAEREKEGWMGFVFHPSF